MNFEFIFRNLWLVFLAIGFLNCLLLKPRIKRNFSGAIEKDKANRFLIFVLLFINFPFLIIGLLQFLGGFDNFFFVFSGQYHNVYVLLSWMLMVLVWGFLLYWVLVKDGAKIISKYRVLFNNMPENETTIKFMIGLMVLGGIAALIIGNVFHFYNVIKTIHP